MKGRMAELKDKKKGEGEADVWIKELIPPLRRRRCIHPARRRRQRQRQTKKGKDNIETVKEDEDPESGALHLMTTKNP